MSKHTPGPWAWTDDGAEDIVESAAGVICRMIRFARPLGAWEANARLIAAAPDLLAALESLADDHEFGATGTVRQDHLRSARAAIAKARGAQP